MEFVIGLIVITAMLFILGMDVTMMLYGFQMLLLLVSFLCTLFFLFCSLILIISKKHSAYLLEIKKSQPDMQQQDNEKKRKIIPDFAFYDVKGEKLRNWFPAETLFRKKIYSRKDCFVRIAKFGKKRLVFDRHSVIIVICGTLLMGISSLRLAIDLLR